MHAEMQEEWKHSIHPSPTISPHPISGNKRINVTYRYYRSDFHPRYTPRCRCGVATVLRCVQRKKENWGRYFWMCHAGLVPGKEGYIANPQLKNASVTRTLSVTDEKTYYPDAHSSNGLNSTTMASLHGRSRNPQVTNNQTLLLSFLPLFLIDR